jgi:carbon monoxide dehydrogenase subunit G
LGKVQNTTSFEYGNRDSLLSANLGSASGIIAKITNETFDIKLHQDGLESKVRYDLVPNTYVNSKNLAKLQL